MSSSSREGQFDNLFATVAGSNGAGIEGLLDEFFGFLQRRTDFYSHEGHTLADIEGVVMKAVRKHYGLSMEKRKKDVEGHRLKDEAVRKKREAMAAAAGPSSADSGGKAGAPSSAAAPVKVAKQASAAAPRIEEIFDTDEGVDEVKAKQISDVIATNDADPEEDGDDDEKGDDHTNPAKHGNGGTTDRYSWTQTLQAVDVLIPVPLGTKGSTCAVEIKAGSLKVGLKGQPPLIDGKLHMKVKTDDCYWTLVENKVIQIQLEKLDNMRWWAGVIQGDPEIDTKKIVPENSKLSDLDGSTRATVEKMMFDQQQKELGRPTSEQQKQLDMLEKLKQANPNMDFSKAKINFGGGAGGFGAPFS